MGLGVLLACAPPLGSDACDAASPLLLFDRSGDGLLSLWRCAKVSRSFSSSALAAAQLSSVPDDL
eukprot:6200565-Pleurochrysis_carterae.AAC.1